MAQHVILTASESPEGGLAALAQRLTEAGMEVERVQPYGVITGRIPATRLADFQAMKDVLDVTPERTFHLPSPDSAIQ